MLEEGTVDPSKIDSAAADVGGGSGSQEVPGSNNGLSEKEKAFFNHESEKFRNELGWLGKPFGGRSEKPGNISALVIILVFIVMIAAYGGQSYVAVNFHDTKPPLEFERMFGGFTSILTLILGYLFGSNSKSDGK